MVLLGVVAVTVVVVVLEEKVLVGAVGGEGDGRDAESREGALESVPAGEDACVAPCFSVMGVDGRLVWWDMMGGLLREKRETHALSQGSYLGCPDAAISFFMSKPVAFGLGPWLARSILELG